MTGHHDGNPDLPDTGGTCCWGAAVYGPERCTCWTTVYDRPQAAPDTSICTATRSRMCDGCAYRPGTAANQRFADQLDTLAGTADVFWCHDGARQVVRFDHPSGVIAWPTIDPDNPPHDPLIVDGVYYDASGEPARVCSGWSARRRALTCGADR